MAILAETDFDAIAQRTRSRDLEAGLGIWSLLSGSGKLPNCEELLANLLISTQDFHLSVKLSGGAIQLLSFGDKLAELAGDLISRKPPYRLANDLAKRLTPILQKAALEQTPVYTNYYSEGSPVVHQWELVALPVGTAEEAAVVCLMVPLQFSQDVLMAIVETNPVGFCAGDVIRNPHGEICDFRIYMVNEAACHIIGQERHKILFAKVSDWFPKFSSGALFQRLVKVIEDGTMDRLEISRRQNGTRQCFAVTAARRSNSLVLAFTDVTELVETKAELSTRHRELLKANQELRTQKEDLRVTAESLELARQALSAEVNRRAALEKKLRTLAEIDELSGLPNRRHFLDLASAELRRAVRYNNVFALLMVDVDRFKSVNDTFGHATGDRVIQSVANSCATICREGIDIAGRIGGEEFALLLPETDLAGGYDLAERLVSMIAGSTIHLGSTKISVTASVGVAEFRPGDQSISEILKRADNALYAAKRGGRNQVAQFAA